MGGWVGGWVGRKRTYLELTSEQITQPALQERNDATEEEEPHTPTRGPETYRRGGWVGGWVRDRMVEEIEAVRTSYCE